MDENPRLRVLIANEKRERLELPAQVVSTLGHDVIAREIYVREVGAVTAREQPDVALVGLGLSSELAISASSADSRACRRERAASSLTTTAVTRKTASANQLRESASVNV